jgi:hypothetical protein
MKSGAREWGTQGIRENSLKDFVSFLISRVPHSPGLGDFVVNYFK